ncbi:hypothetical protein [Hyalangium rubrum]|uniref:Uncharacterized protein n=1 Tax=Hyalangium rubrum TaxID=3103134 RepID=A0ABU5GUX0_9BACT|nr:hypothetical protein [Hyalangium sp. s54d21]MDY7224836.1 hypothetical protein [Hyalangium sp. s54d21]
MLNRAATFRRYTATLLVVLWGLPLLVALGHSEEHAHRYCQEHQTFEDMARSGGATVSLAAEATSRLMAMPASTQGADRMAHESCPLLTTSPRDEALTLEMHVVVSACLAVSRPATAPPRPLSSIPILATAPKSSPPARA